MVRLFYSLGVVDHQPLGHPMSSLIRLHKSTPEAAFWSCRFRRCCWGPPRWSSPWPQATGHLCHCQWEENMKMEEMEITGNNPKEKNNVPWPEVSIIPQVLVGALLTCPGGCKMLTDRLATRSTDLAPLFLNEVPGRCCGWWLFQRLCPQRFCTAPGNVLMESYGDVTPSLE